MTFTSRLKDFFSRYYVLLFCIALALALVLRFFRLGSPSLSDSEAQQALQALALTRGQSTVVGGQAGYVGLTSILFFLFDGTNFFARLWPALFGSALVLVPLLFRKQLDNAIAILLAFLIAMEPGLVALSRAANGTMITITALTAAIGLLLNKKMIPAGVLFGLALIGSEIFWPLALVLGVSWLIIGDKQAIQFDSHEKSRWWIPVLAAGITVVLVSTQFLLKPNGISGVGSGLVSAIQSWRQPVTMRLSSFLLVLLMTQFPAIILGIWGLVNGLRAKSPLARFMGLWWVIGLIVGLLNPSRNAWTLVIFDLPIFVLAATQIKNVIEGLVVESRIVTLMESVVTLALILFSTLNFLNMVNFPPTDPIQIRNRLIGTLLPLALWIAFTSLLAWGWDVVSTKSGLFIGLGLLLFALLIGSGWKAAELGSRAENEFLSSGGYISGEPDLMQTMTDLARWNSGSATRIDVDVAGLDSPSIMWAIRDFKKVTTDSAFPMDTTPSIVISGTQTILQTPSMYRGQLLVWSIQPDLTQMQWQDWIKWHFMRVVPEQKENIILWVRNDLFKDVSSQQQAQ